MSSQMRGPLAKQAKTQSPVKAMAKAEEPSEPTETEELKTGATVFRVKQ